MVLIQHQDCDDDGVVRVDLFSAELPVVRSTIAEFSEKSVI
jgi:hypothetical protein